jgi:hypothetical protein
MDDVKYDIKREEEEEEEEAEEEHGLLKFVETVRQCSRKKRRALLLMSMRS